MEREEVWLRAWVALARSRDTRSYDVATTWADKCLAAYNERFPPTEYSKPEPTKSSSKE